MTLNINYGYCVSSMSNVDVRYVSDLVTICHQVGIMIFNVHFSNTS